MIRPEKGSEGKRGKRKEGKKGKGSWSRSGGEEGHAEIGAARPQAEAGQQLPAARRGGESLERDPHTGLPKGTNQPSDTFILDF